MDQIHEEVIQSDYMSDNQKALILEKLGVNFHLFLITYLIYYIGRFKFKNATYQIKNIYLILFKKSVFLFK